MSDAIGQVYVEIGGKIDGLTSALNSVQQQLMAAKENTANWGQQFTQVGTQMAVVGGIITGALTAIVLKTVEAEYEFQHLSEKTGISVQDLSSMSLALNSVFNTDTYSGTIIYAITTR